MDDIKQRRILFRRRGEDGGEIDDRFDVEFPLKAIIPLGILYSIFLYGQWYYKGDALSIVVLLILTIIPILLWSSLGPSLSERIILKWVLKVEGKKFPSPDVMFVGFPAAVKDTYYIEANPMDLRMDNFVQVVMRIKEAVFLSIGLCILTAMILGNFFFDRLALYWDVVMGDPYYGQNELILDTAIWLGPFAMIILFLVIPLFWITEDVQIYRIDRLQDARRIGEYLRTGLLSKVLGFIGIIFAYDVSRGFAQEVHGINADPLTLYATTFETFILIFIACAGAPFLVSTIYLLRYHSVWVNNIRIKASQYIPIGTMEIAIVESEDLTLLSHQERIETIRNRLVIFIKTPLGKKVALILLILGLAGTFFMGFVFTGVWSDPIGYWDDTLPQWLSELMPWN